MGKLAITFTLGILVIYGFAALIKRMDEDAAQASNARVALAKAAAKPVVDSQVAAGEWKIEIQTPPCDNVKNLQVIFPKHSGEPLTVECDLMPVAEK